MARRTATAASIGLLPLAVVAVCPRAAAALEFDVLGTTYHASDLSVVVYAFLYAPVVLVVVIIACRALLRPLPAAARRFVCVACAIALLTLPWWDTVAIAQRARALCENESGLHVYATAERPVDGFVGAGSIEWWTSLGFEYLEVEGPGGAKFRKTLRDGVPVVERVAGFASRYEIVQPGEAPYAGDFTIMRHQVRVRDTGEILGEHVQFRIYPGRFDRWVGTRTFGYTTRGCRHGTLAPAVRRRFGDDAGFEHLVLAVLRPQPIKDDSK